MKMWLRNLSVFKNLLRREFAVMKKDYLNDLIDLIIWPASVIVSFGYVLPLFGMDPNYGSFLSAGAIASTFFYLSLGMASDLVYDFDSLRFIDSQLIAPVSSYSWVLVERVCAFSIHSFLLSLPLLPLSKILLATRFDMTHFSLFKYLFMMIGCSICWGFFGLWLAAMIEKPRAFAHVWRRVYTPMQLIGCYWFSFAMAQKVFPRLGYVALLNPLTFMTEGMRSAVLGAEGFMNFWLCLLLLSIFTVFLAFIACRRLKNRYGWI